MKRLLLVLTICGLTTLWGDDAKPKTAEKKKPANAAMPAQKPAPEMREMLSLVGTWSSHDTMEKIEGMMPGGEGTSTVVYRRGPGGHSVIMNVTGTSGPMASFRGMGVISWSPDENAYKMAWVENMMPGLTLETGHKDGDNYVMEGETTMMGKKYKIKDVLSDRTPTSFTMTSYMDDGTGEKKVMTIKLKKEEAAPKKEAQK